MTYPFRRTGVFTPLADGIGLIDLETSNVSSEPVAVQPLEAIRFCVVGGGGLDARHRVGITFGGPDVEATAANCIELQDGAPEMIGVPANASHFAAVGLGPNSIVFDRALKYARGVI